MRKQPRKIALHVASAIALVTFTAVAAPPHAPSDQYGPFDYRSVTIKDTKTKLAWTRSTTKLSASAAETYCGSLGAGVRLPTVKELLSLVDEVPHDEYEGLATVTKYIDPAAFPDTPTDQPYWTSTRDLPNGASARLLVDFGTGETRTADVGDTRNVRCVVYQP